MKPSHNSDADNSTAKQRAEAAMERAAWADALVAWKDWWTEAGERASSDPDAMHDRAVCHFHCGDKGLALDWLNRAADVQPDYSYRYSSRGWMKQALGDTHGAIADYQKALERDPEDAVTWNNLGLLEEQLGYQEQAKERYRVSDELLGILKERGIDPESDAETAKSKTASARTSDDSVPGKRTFGSELRRALFTKDGLKELWKFVSNGFTLRG